MTITSWRIVQSRHLLSAFSGEGAKLYPGRWNHRGIPVVYTAGSLSLAAMEMLVHLDSAEILQLYIVVPVTFDKRFCLTLDPTVLPADWTSVAHLPYTRDIGTTWVARNDSVVLGVPSSIVGIETNFLLNPQHPDFHKLEIGSARKFHYDPRLLKHHA